MSKVDIEKELSESLLFAAQFQKDAMRTNGEYFKVEKPFVLHGVMGLVTEVQELATDDHLEEEVGDNIWFPALIATGYEMDFAEICEKTYFFMPTKMLHTSVFGELCQTFAGDGEVTDEIKKSVNNLLKNKESIHFISSGIRANLNSIAVYMLDILKAETYYGRKEHISLADKISKTPKDKCVKISTKDAIIDALCFFMQNLAQFCYVEGIDTKNAAKKVIAKLRVRYPEKFSADNANNRDFQKESQIFEKKDVDAN